MRCSVEIAGVTIGYVELTGLPASGTRLSVPLEQTASIARWHELLTSQETQFRQAGLSLTARTEPTDRAARQVWEQRGAWARTSDGRRVAKLVGLGSSLHPRNDLPDEVDLLFG
jgi:hypothetical protein